MTRKRWPILVLVAACLLGAPKPAAAMAIANSSIAFKNLAITPAAGISFSLDGAWLLEAFAHADNSLGETDDDFALSLSPDAIGAAAAVTWASATGTASAPNDPPDLVVTGAAGSDVNIPVCGPAAAFSKGRGTLINLFTLSGGGMVQFDIDVSGLLNVMTSGCGLSATTETVFTLEVDGTPILFRHDLLSIGPADAVTLAFAKHLANTVTLDAGSHFLLLEADSESRGQVVPEPPAGLLLVAGLAVLAAARRRRRLGAMEA